MAVPKHVTLTIDGVAVNLRKTPCWRNLWETIGTPHDTRTGGQPMRKVFDAVMRVVSSLIGLLMIAVGIVWILQGLNLAFRVGFMVGEKRWVFFGGILALVGIAQVIWSNTRQSARDRPDAARAGA